MSYASATQQKAIPPIINTTRSTLLATELKQSEDLNSFQEALNEHPEEHFLSPLTSSERYSFTGSFDLDTDSESDDFEWNTGITDFALFDQDHRRVKANNEPLPSKWNAFIASQAAAYVESARNSTRLIPLPASLTDELVPALTPDNSPRLGPDLDEDKTPGAKPALSKPNVRFYLAPLVEEDEYTDAVESSDEDDLSLGSHVNRARERRRARLKVTRPGLSYSRTMSGKLHVWRRPSWALYTVDEEDGGGGGGGERCGEERPMVE